MSDAVETKNDQQWQTLVKTDEMKQYTAKLLESYLRVKMSLEMKNHGVDIRTAMQDFSFAMKAVERQSNKIVSPKGFAHLLCGEAARYPAYPAQHDKECWKIDGELQWQSLTQVKVSYKNPESGWLSHLYMQRTGLFNWQAVGLELPVDAMFKQLEKQLSV